MAVPYVSIGIEKHKLFNTLRFKEVSDIKTWSIDSVLYKENIRKVIMETDMQEMQFQTSSKPLYIILINS